MDFVFPIWLLPTLGSALLLGFYDVSKKRAVLDNPVAPVLFYANLFGLATLSIALFFTGRLGTAISCSGAEWCLIMLKALIVGSSWVCVYYAMRELPISIAAPVRASSPLWVFAGSLLLYREIPSLLQGLAMLTIFGGYAIFALSGKLEHIHWQKHRGVHALILGTLLGSAAALFDKYLLNVKQIPPLTVQFFFTLNLVLVLGGAWLFTRIPGVKTSGRKFRWHWTIAATGILIIAADFCYFYAVSLPDIHISVISLVRRSNCIVSFALGAMLFREKHLRVKLIALMLILAGVAMLAFAK